MKLALYCPVYGYYEGEADKIGQGGDFYTSVSVGSVFGELLAFQFSNWLDDLPQMIESRSGRFDLEIIEAGANRGQLAADILCWIRAARTDLWDKLGYCIIEPSTRLRQKQRKLLAGFGNKVRWVSGFNEVKRNSAGKNVHGIIFSNELLDALPVRRIGWRARTKTWFEWGVALEDDRFVWVEIPSPVNPIIGPEVPREVLDFLPEDFTTEICPSATQWWQQAAGVLGQGKLISIDYGLAAEDFILPERSQGTLRSYSKHKITGDLLINPGKQDITAHVNFTAIQVAGEKTGLKTDMFASQEKFLSGTFDQTLKRPAGFVEWTQARLRQFQTLTHPQHLGRSFRVLVQSRPVESAANS
jgi:SAM-dependent MidA family methyltransferase